jgi:hypothetical protein
MRCSYGAASGVESLERAFAIMAIKTSTRFWLELFRPPSKRVERFGGTLRSQHVDRQGASVGRPTRTPAGPARVPAGYGLGLGVGPMAERDAAIAKWHSYGLTAVRIGGIIGMSGRAVRHHLAKMNLTSWSKISSRELLRVVAEAFTRGHGALGRRGIEARLLEQGLRVQRRRIVDAMRRLGKVRTAPRKVRRRRFYEGMGPGFVSHHDQNEHAGLYGFKLLASIEGYSRCPLYWEVVTSLRGIDHSRFFQNMVKALGNRMTAHSVFDGAAAWNGVTRAIKIYFRNKSKSTLIALPDGPVPVTRFRRTTAQRAAPEGTIRVYRCNRTSSVHSIPVERQWFEANNISEMFVRRFRALEGAGYLRGGPNKDALDLWCLHKVFLPVFEERIGEHFRAQQLRRKERTTSNPNFPRGTFRPLDLLLNGAGNQQGQSHWHAVSDEEVAAVDAFLERYHRTADGTEASSPWQRDPLHSRAQRKARKRRMEGRAPFATLESEYIELRRVTKYLIQNPPDSDSDDSGDSDDSEDEDSDESA